MYYGNTRRREIKKEIKNTEINANGNTIFQNLMSQQKQFSERRL